MAQKTLDLLFTKWSAPAIRRAVKSARIFRPGDRAAAWVFPSNVPDPVVVHVFLGLAAGVDSIVRFSSRAGGFGKAFLESVRRESPLFRGAVREIPSKENFLSAARTASLAGAFGDDASIREIRSRLGPKVRFIGYGHRTSFGIVFASSLLPPRLARTVRACALDVWLADQRGCLSPRLYFVEGDSGPFAHSLALELAALNDGSMKRPYDLALERRLFLDRLAAEAAAGRAVRILPAGEAAVYTWDKRGVPPGSAGQVAGVKPFSSLESVARDLAPYRRKLQGLSVAGTPAELARVRRRFARTSAKWIAPAGSLQNPPIEALL